MFVKFGKGRCPICGDVGVKKQKDVYFCQECEITFSEFGFFGELPEKKRRLELT